jgi:lipopolysaccharide/colanic/teichoic acid biosynthesis glycosyltransferase
MYVPEDDATKLAAAIRYLAGCPESVCRMGRHARELAEQVFSWDHKVLQFRNVLSLTLSNSKARAAGAARTEALIGKRLFDCLLSGTALILLSLPLAIIAILVKLTSTGPVFFFQSRAGFHETPFNIMKVRTMVDARAVNGNIQPDGDRLTRFGCFLRSTSLDELPELINVLKGEMSLVGPRPLFLRYLPYYTEREHSRHNLRPGITGWAQINGRNHLAWSERLEKDVWYVENWSFWLDIRILLVTVCKVLTRAGVAVDSQIEEPDFDAERRRTGSMTTIPEARMTFHPSSNPR